MSASEADRSALVLLSGGQDSTTCLAWALDRFDRVETLGFYYGQKHKVEMTVRDRVRRGISEISSIWATRLREDHVLDAAVIGVVGQSPLTGHGEVAVRDSNLPSTFVPGRNLVFLTLGGALAYRRGIKNVVTGVCETDYSGYPDCRDHTIKALQVAINLGMQTSLVIHTPLMWVDKAGTWEMASSLGGARLLELIRNDTHTCYEGDRSVLHEWGFGCGECAACSLRASGWLSFQQSRDAARVSA